MKFKEIEISNRRYGRFDKTKIFLTENLYNRLSREQTRIGGTMLARLQNGRAVRGFKHLIILIKQTDKKNKIILTDKKSKLENKTFHVNYNEYRKHGESIFYPFYRETGLTVAQSFLAKNYPNIFEVPEKKVSQKELKKVEEDLPGIIQKLSKKIKNKKQLIEQTTDILIELRKKEQEQREVIKDLKKLQQQSSISLYSGKLKEFKERLTKRIHETKGINSWQNWIYENNWLFGIHYQKPIEKTKVGFNNIPDFLFPTLDGFIDILEIKRPDHEVIREDPSHQGSFIWAKETNKAIGQVINYITQIEDHQYELKDRLNKEYGDIYESKILTVKPRAFILIGRSDNWTEKKKEAFRKLNYSLHGIEVITYSDLFKRGEKIIQMYTD